MTSDEAMSLKLAQDRAYVQGMNAEERAKQARGDRRGAKELQAADERRKNVITTSMWRAQLSDLPLAAGRRRPHRSIKNLRADAKKSHAQRLSNAAASASAVLASASALS